MSVLPNTKCVDSHLPISTAVEIQVPLSVSKTYLNFIFLVRPSFIITIGRPIYHIKGLFTRDTKMVVQILYRKPQSQKTKKTGFRGIFYIGNKGRTGSSLDFKSLHESKIKKRNQE
jgi:hypothetical protein